MLKQYPTCMILRVRMPISDDLSSRSFVTKIAKYEKVVDIPNSMTVLTELLPASLILLTKCQKLLLRVQKVDECSDTTCMSCMFSPGDSQYLIVY